MLEKNFQSKIVKRLKSMGAVVIKYEQNATTIQGFPDLIWFYKRTYGVIEVKKYKGADFQPLQPEWLERMGEMSYSWLVYPENFKLMDQCLKEIKKNEDSGIRQEVQDSGLREYIGHAWV